MTLVTDYALTEDINFDTTTIGPATVTLSSSTIFWSDISGIREGFRFILPNDGLAVVSKDPQFQSSNIEVNITQSLTGTNYVSGDWVLRVPATKEIKDYLPRNVKSTLLLPDYNDSLQNVSIDEIQDAIRRLRNIRRWNIMDKEYLDVFLQTMGMTFKSELFDEETRRRFIKELPTFLQLSGTKFFINYLSFVIGASFIITELWSNDYKDFIERDDIPGGDETGWYPTNHVELEFDANFFGILDVELIIQIFYILASTPLVLQRILQNLTSELTVQPYSQGGLQIWYTGQDTTPTTIDLNAFNPLIHMDFTDHSSSAIYLADNSGNGNDAIFNSTGDRPVTGGTINGVPALEFTYVGGPFGNRKLVFPTATVFTGASVDIFVVAHRTEATGGAFSLPHFGLIDEIGPYGEDSSVSTNLIIPPGTEEVYFNETQALNRNDVYDLSGSPSVIMMPNIVKTVSSFNLSQTGSSSNSYNINGLIGKFLVYPTLTTAQRTLVINTLKSEFNII